MFYNDPTTDPLPDRDVDALLLFELTYYAFGTPDSGGVPWTIRNGLDRTADDATTAETDGSTYGFYPGGAPGGAFVVKFGNGSAREDLAITPQ